MNIEPVLTHLLTRHDPFICLIKGPWGVGKTYFIKQFIADHSGSLAKDNYAYVSLFGISTTDQLMQSIFLNSIPTKTLNSSMAEVFSRSSKEEVGGRLKYLFRSCETDALSCDRYPFVRGQ
jgi:Cdc6-like AAA superfamily ATPase